MSDVHSGQELCPTVTAAFVLLGKKWTGLVIQVLASGNLQFSELARKLPGISARMLTVRLKELEEARLVERTVHGTMPVHVRYALTAKGRGLSEVLEGLVRWARENRKPGGDEV